MSGGCVSFWGWAATWKDNQQQSSIQGKLVAGSIVWVSMKAASGLIERNMKSIMELRVTPRRFKV